MFDRLYVDSITWLNLLRFLCLGTRQVIICVPKANLSYIVCRWRQWATATNFSLTKCLFSFRWRFLWTISRRINRSTVALCHGCSLALLSWLNGLESIKFHFKCGHRTWSWTFFGLFKFVRKELIEVKTYPIKRVRLRLMK